MALLDRFINGFTRALDAFAGPMDEIFRAIATQDPDAEKRDEVQAQFIDDLSPIDEFAREMVDANEEFIVRPIQDEGELTPDNIEELIDEVEGNAAGVLFTAMGTGLSIETGSAGQIDTIVGELVAALAGLGVDDVTGTELKWRMEKGVGPAMEAKVAKEHRSEFVDLGDAVEFALRTKTNDDNWLHASGASDEAVDKVGSVEPVNPENILEEWGIRDDNLDILEEVGIKVLEAEELLETPVEFGVIPPRDVVEKELARSGLAEDTKQLFLDVVDSIPTASTAWEERTRYEELINLLDDAADQGELDPDAARPLIADLDDRVIEELVARWQLIQEVPNKAPTRSQVEGSFAHGYTDVDTLVERYDQVDVDPAKYDDLVRAAVMDDIDGDLQTAFAVGNLSAGEFGELMDYVGLSSEAQEALMRGSSLSQFTEFALQDEAEPEALPVESIAGIGDSRGAGLRAVGIETVADLAVADLELVADAAQVEEGTAQEYIDAAILRTS